MKNSTQHIVVVSNTSASPHLNSTADLAFTLTYGGIAVAVIIAMTCFSQTLLNSVNKVIKTVNKKTK